MGPMIRWLLLLILVPFSVSAKNLVQAELVAETQTISAGSEVLVGLYLRITPGWHVYWKNPGDTGRPTRVELQWSKGAVASEFLWPYPKKFSIPPLVNYGYEGEVLLPFRVRVPRNFRGSQLKAVGEAAWLVCEKECVPERQAVELVLPVSSSAMAPNPVWKKAFDLARSQIPRAVAPGLVKVTQTNEEMVIHLEELSRTFDIPAGVAADFFPAEQEKIRAAEPAVMGHTGRGSWLRLQKYTEGAMDQLAGVLLIHSEGKTWPLEIQEKVAPLALLDQGPGTLLLLVLAFLGGVILNLMPCVFPVLGIKLMSLVKGSGAHRDLIRSHAVAYTGGILASFWVLAAILLVVKAGGRELGWGFQLQQPWFVMGLAVLFFLMALNLMGLFELGGAWVGVGQKLTEKEGVWGSFFTGVLAVVVSTPCSAPFMGTAVGAALLRPGWETLLIFTSLGLGLASPYLFVSAFPEFLRLLPKPGTWMNHLKEALAVPLLGTVVWLLWIYEVQKRGGASGIVVATTLAAFLFFALRRTSRAWFSFWHVGLIVLYFGTAFAVPLVGSREQPRQSGQHQNQWLDYSPEAVELERKAGRPVLIDFTAEWCLTCKVNERLVLESPEVKDLFEREKVALLRGDWTNEDPRITRALAEFGRAGVPLYVVWAKGAREPQILPQVLTTEIVREALLPGR